LRSPIYVDLSILDAFNKYAPASDGNDPVAYANAVAAALGVAVSTRVGDLDDGQMQVMQDKIQEIEGALAGVGLAWDAPEIPPEIAQLLPAHIPRQARRPRAIPRQMEAFSTKKNVPKALVQIVVNLFDNT
jgi:hypothetical protein